MRPLIGTILVLGLVACGGDSSGDQDSSTEASGGGTDSASSRPEDKKAPKSPEKVKLASGVEILDMIEGDGPEAVKGGTVTCHATGWTKDGKKFWSSYDDGRSYDFPLIAARPGVRGVIQGWVEGIPGMKVGGKRKVWIPWKLGYPDGNPAAGIAPKTDLVFEVELLGVK